MTEVQPLPKPLWRRVLGTSFGIGLATILLIVPLILVVPRPVAWVVAFIALCIYPILDAPRNAARWSWFLGAIGSTVVWLVVMGVLVGTADSRERMREGAMVFMLPAMIFPLVLLLSGVVRLERHFRGKPRESGVKLATVLGGTFCALMVGVPIVLNMIPVGIERVTGNTPSNTTYGGSESEVIEADPQHVSVRLSTGRAESYRLTPETRFGFLGPGPRPADNPAGPAWLKAGQKVKVDYVNRDHVAHATYIAVWIDRKGCAGEERWSALPPPAADAALAGSNWEGRRGDAEGPGGETTTFELLPAGRLTYRDANSDFKNPAGGWRQSGTTVLIQVNDCYALYDATWAGERMSGQFSNEMGFRQPWTARRTAAP